MLEYVPIPLLKLLYPIREPSRTRDRDLKVLCLGLGRTGTESLCAALLDLGYSDVYHGFRCVAPEHVGGSVMWYRLGLAKFKYHDANPFTAASFDKMLGNCEAVTDLPCVAFGVELLRAYPDAKVVLNRRRDVEAWYTSQAKTIDTIYRDWPSWARQWFEIETFWIVRMVIWVPRALAGWDFERNGRQLYREHYAALEAECRKQGRPWLDWTVEDGWGPLCEFIGKKVPDHPFPSGNAQDEYHAKRIRILEERTRRGNRNMAVAGVLLVIGIAAGLSWYLRQ